MKKPRLEIFTDFDGTVTRGDTIDLLLETLADPSWKQIEERWINGEISSRECMALQVPLIQGGWQAMLAVLQTVEVDNTFAAFAGWCKFRKIALSVVSDGIDKVIDYLLSRENIKIARISANHLLESDGGQLALSFPERGSRVVCPSGPCKCQVLDNAGANVIKVVIGDGRSDFCWARNADILFAKDKLARYCSEQGIAFIPYENFLQIRMTLEELHSADTAGRPASVPAGKLKEAPLMAQS
jgi:2,3-diketo-5-methylthio-1-phosphopentane phosphatase